MSGVTGASFDVLVSIFVGSDIADQAHVFATVNLEQTKVGKSLAIDLFDLAKTRSPIKTAHNISIALDNTEGSPFYHRIKRLGVATEGRVREAIDGPGETLNRYCDFISPLTISKFAPRLSAADRGPATLQALARVRFELPGLHRPIGMARLRHTAVERLWECVQSQPSAFLENTMVARPGRGNGWPTGGLTRSKPRHPALLE